MRVGRNVSSCDVSSRHRPRLTSPDLGVSGASPASPLALVAWGLASGLPVRELFSVNG